MRASRIVVLEEAGLWFDWEAGGGGNFGEGVDFVLEALEGFEDGVFAGGFALEGFEEGVFFAGSFTFEGFEEGVFFAWEGFVFAGDLGDGAGVVNFEQHFKEMLSQRSPEHDKARTYLSLPQVP